MPSQQQLEKAEQEKRDLERELQLLENAEDASDSAKRIMEFISGTDEPLVDPDNTLANGGGCACIVL
eukprot:CAMPEP_0202694538 /NCGR_PEP_ID=MMETSP1385-20130828/8375_1 /ASSEMBLY_ACC=CAM_ASM_000861 /TAXON_ID=933848 /ORGANISM="Elphidium margaritaceum" /LENGTH=66 /DNA_ID=CAMNT_0049350403 /DNA_START=115 /DNA_END=315 /DNA_ORIENTATION=+